MAKLISDGKRDEAVRAMVAEVTPMVKQLQASPQMMRGNRYQFRQINPVDDQDGGEPGGNIRVGFLFRTDRGLSFVDRPGGTPTGISSRASRSPPSPSRQRRRNPEAVLSGSK